MDKKLERYVELFKNDNNNILIITNNSGITNLGIHDVSDFCKLLIIGHKVFQSDAESTLSKVPGIDTEQAAEILDGFKKYCSDRLAINGRLYCNVLISNLDVDTLTIHSLLRSNFNTVGDIYKYIKAFADVGVPMNKALMKIRNIGETRVYKLIDALDRLDINDV